jgi:hypothetical protein
MGYDSNECLLCYLNDGSNNVADGHVAISICTSCFVKQSKPLRGRATRNDIVKKVFNQTCDFCMKTNCLVLNKVALCSEHVPRERLSIEPSDELSNFHGLPPVALCSDDVSLCDCAYNGFDMSIFLENFNNTKLHKKQRENKLQHSINELFDDSKDLATAYDQFEECFESSKNQGDYKSLLDVIDSLTRENRQLENYVSHLEEQLEDVTRIAYNSEKQRKKLVKKINRLEMAFDEDILIELV